MVRESPSPLGLVRRFLQPPASVVWRLESPAALVARFCDIQTHCGDGFRFKEPFHQQPPPLDVAELWPHYRPLDLNFCQGLQKNRNPASQAFGGLAMVVRNLNAHCWPQHGPPFCTSICWTSLVHVTKDSRNKLYFRQTAEGRPPQHIRPVPFIPAELVVATGGIYEVITGLQPPATIASLAHCCHSIDVVY